MPATPSPRRAAAGLAPLAAGLLALLAGCQGPGGAPGSVTRAEVEAVMDAQQTAWNRGDLETFVSYYDPGMTFLGARGVTRGTDDLLENYRRGYPTAAERGRLAFDLLELRPVGADAILVLGRYRIARAAPASGYFTLLLARTPAGLRILHDHTSATPPADPDK